MKQTAPVVFLVDVDDTLLENAPIQTDLKAHIDREFGARCGDQFWAIQEELFNQFGYRDYLRALQRFQVEHPYEPHLVTATNFLVDYPFASRLYPGALNVLERFREWGRTVILTEGDMVLQPRKVQRSGIYEAVEGHVLIYAHKEKALRDVEQRYPADHYVLVDDKPGILAAVKRAWGTRVTTIFARQGESAPNPPTRSSHPLADITVEKISELLAYYLPELLNGRLSLTQRFWPFARKLTLN